MPDAVVGNQPNGPTRRFGEVPGDDGGAARHGERATTEAEVGVARGRAVRDGLTWACWRPVRLASFELTVGSDRNGVDE